MEKRAVILAGGKGTRLRPYTVVLPKPLMPVGDHPILEVIIRQLASCQFKRITMAVNHQADLIKAFFGSGSKWNINIDYSLETLPLSTVGPLKLIKDLPENFLLMNGDVLTDLNLKRLYEEHIEAGRLFTIAASRRTHIVDYGVLETVNGGSLVSFREKPQFDYTVSMGIYIVNRAILDMVPEGVKYGFDNLMLELLARKQLVQVHPYEGDWLDIGRPDDYAQAIEEFDQRKALFLR